MKNLDVPDEIRNGEELDPARVKEFLKDKIKGLEGDLVIKQFPGGYSNLTYMVKVGKKEMVLRRPPMGKKAKSAHDMAREYRILKALEDVFPYAPRPLAYTEDPWVMGSPFYVMERIKGIILRKDLPPEICLSPGDAAKLCDNFVDLLSRLHGLDFKKIGLEDFGKPKGYIARQVEGWSRRYRNAGTDDAPDFHGVMDWLQEHMPEEDHEGAIIHNDYKFDNVVLNPENPMEIIGILDWEMSALGDPLMDLGGSLAYWVNAGDPEDQKLIRTLPTTIPGMMTRGEIVDLYAKKTGRKIETFDFYYCFGLFRLAVIAQQIYFRYFHGQTKDKRFAMLIYAVQILEKVALNVIAKSDL